MTPASVAGIDWSSPSGLRNAYRVHVRKRNLHAAHLNRLWDEERELIAERDRMGRTNDVISVQEIERELHAVRYEIDQRRILLTRENQLISMIDARLSGR